MWYVISVLGRREKYAKQLIENFVDSDVLKELFIPEYEIMKRYQGQWRMCYETFIPGYLFVITEKPHELAVQLHNVPTFTKLLGNSDTFIPLDDHEIALINAFTESNNRIVGMSEGLIEGDEIVIVKGPLMNHTGLIKKVDRHKRLAYLEIDLFERKTSVKIGLEIVRKRP